MKINGFLMSLWIIYFVVVLFVVGYIAKSDSWGLWIVCPIIIVGFLNGIYFLDKREINFKLKKPFKIRIVLR